MVTAMCLCADKRIVSSYSKDLYDLNNFFLGILRHLLLSVVSDIKDDFLYL
jgi:hypothetical protein